MDERGVGRLADLLINARHTGRRMPGLPRDIRPASITDGMKVQDEVERRLGLEIGGWKVGIPPGVPTYRGPIFAPVVQRSPAIYGAPAGDEASGHATLVAEGEIAFKIGRDLPARDRPYTEEEVINAVASACTAIEILQWRLSDVTTAPVAEKIADNLGNAGLVLGEPCTTWQALDRRQVRARFDINGKNIVDDVVGKEGPADPVELLMWLANHLTGRGGLKAGQFVTTGTWTGSHAVKSGDVMVVHLAGLGEAKASFT